MVRKRRVVLSIATPKERPLHALLVSTLVVALAEIGDKTQLLALVLAARYRKPWPIVAGIALATLANHALAGLLGGWLSGVLPETWLRGLLALSFFAMAVWVMIPDKADGADKISRRFGPFFATLVAFFLVEIGDKTQIATVALAAQFPDLLAVIAGTTLGMLIANVPVVFLGNVFANRIPMKLVHGIAAAGFALMGGLVLLS